MIVSMSSAEFEINSKFMESVFNAPRTIYIDKQENGYTIRSYVRLKEEDRPELIYKPVSLEQVNNLKTWDSNKQQIISLMKNCSTQTIQDVNGLDWIVQGGTGFAVYYCLGRQECLHQ